MDQQWAQPLIAKVTDDRHRSRLALEAHRGRWQQMLTYEDPASVCLGKLDNKGWQEVNLRAHSSVDPGQLS